MCCYKSQAVMMLSVLFWCVMSSCAQQAKGIGSVAAMNRAVGIEQHQHAQRRGLLRANEMPKDDSTYLQETSRRSLYQSTRNYFQSRWNAHGTWTVQTPSRQKDCRCPYPGESSSAYNTHYGEIILPKHHSSCQNIKYLCPGDQASGRILWKCPLRNDDPWQTGKGGQGYRPRHSRSSKRSNMSNGKGRYRPRHSRSRSKSRSKKMSKGKGKGRARNLASSKHSAVSVKHETVNPRKLWWWNDWYQTGSSFKKEKMKNMNNNMTNKGYFLYNQYQTSFKKDKMKVMNNKMMNKGYFPSNQYQTSFKKDKMKMMNKKMTNKGYRPSNHYPWWQKKIVYLPPNHRRCIQPIQTPKPSPSPTASPTERAPTSLGPPGPPTGMPTVSPSSSPSSTPTWMPSATPSASPSTVPSSMPSANPSVLPSFNPSKTPTTSPSSNPTDLPTLSPTTEEQTDEPTFFPTVEPTVEETLISSSSRPSNMPSGLPSLSPTNLPTVVPSESPSFSPSRTPSKNPSSSPSGGPSTKPSFLPTGAPNGSSGGPTSSVFPSNAPSNSASPSSLPSDLPSTVPSSTFPTGGPSGGPTIPIEPSESPTFSLIPSTTPSLSPTAEAILLDCDEEVDIEAEITACHESSGDACGTCEFVPLPANANTCDSLNEWYCELNCCSECDDLYEEAFQCAEFLNDIDDEECSRECAELSSEAPSGSPSLSPSESPSVQPSTSPNAPPSSSSTTVPSSRFPSASPSSRGQTASPTRSPASSPSTEVPTVSPTSETTATESPTIESLTTVPTSETTATESPTIESLTTVPTSETSTTESPTIESPTALPTIESPSPPPSRFPDSSNAPSPSEDIGSLVPSAEENIISLVPSTDAPTVDAPTAEPSLTSGLTALPTIELAPIESPAEPTSDLQPTTEPTFDSISLICENGNVGSNVIFCHVQNIGSCGSCEFNDLSASAETCEDLNTWFCDLVCCDECSDSYENAYQCAEQTLGFDIGECSRQCEVPLDCFAFDLEQEINFCHDENDDCEGCEYVPLSPSLTTCDELNGWFCELNCCESCFDLYDDALFCAEDVNDRDGCSRDCQEPTQPPSILPSDSRTIAAILAEEEDLSTLFTLVDRAGLLDDLDSDGNLTLFAPTNDAFDEVDLPSDGPEDNISSILLYHVVDGPVELDDGNLYSTLIGATVFISLSATNEAKVNDSNIGESITASNGFVYIIDEVLLPFVAPSNSPSESPSEAPTQEGNVEPTLDEGNEIIPDPTAEAPSIEIPSASPSESPSELPTIVGT